MHVLKFGGSSVATAENIQKVVSIVASKLHEDKTAVVVSALGGITDLLLQCGFLAATGNSEYKSTLKTAYQRHIETTKDLLHSSQSDLLNYIEQEFRDIEDICHGVYLLKEFSAVTKDRLVSYGELLSSRIIAAKFVQEGVSATWADAREIIITDDSHTNATVNFTLTNEKMRKAFSSIEQQLVIVPGFIASTINGKTTTLGRGGSDYTAAIVAAALDAAKLEIWTDVSGIMTADPRMVKTAKPIESISYQEAMELSHFGAKVIYPPTMLPVMKKNIPVWIKNTFEPSAAGTIIKNRGDSDESNIRGISSINEIALVSLEGSGMIGIPGFSKRLFEALANERINVIIISQSSSEHSICVGIDVHNVDAAKKVVDSTFSYEIETGIVDPLIVEQDLSIVALVGDNMKNHTGISGKMFGALGKNGINLRAIAQGSSERNISAIVNKKDVKKALNVLHEEFFETSYKQVHVFIAGIGNVGGKLLAQVDKQQDYLKENLRMQIKVAGMANSRKMLFNDEGIELKQYDTLVAEGEEMKLERFIETIKAKNLRNSVFVDVTANAEVAGTYPELLTKSIAIVACNKIACSSGYDYYKTLNNLSKEYNAPFLFETNVGAGLPIIGTLKDLLRSGDKVNRIQAVLSGTLNFVFNNYDGSRPFAQVVKQAQDEGYTEPDPRLDLSGTDVMRKIMILAREAGEVLELDDVSNNSFMPPSCMQGSVDEFYREMEKHEEHFKALYEKANASGKKLKFVATYNNGKASVGLEQIPGQHDLYNLYGKDNIVLFYTNRYPEQPLVVKGAGAGADVTASGLFADIIRAGSY